MCPTLSLWITTIQLTHEGPTRGGEGGDGGGGERGEGERGGRESERGKVEGERGREGEIVNVRVSE